MREYGYSIDQVLNMGYFLANRLWFIVDELKARDLQNHARLFDLPIATQEYRDNIDNWLKSRQPRTRTEQMHREIPEDVLAMIQEQWDNG